MKRTLLLTALALAAIWTAACGAAINTNTVANTNSNAAKPAAAAPTAETFLDMEKKANEAYAKGDGAYFEGMLSDKAVMSMGKDRMDKAAIVSMIKTAKCDMKDGIKLTDPQMSKINDDTYAFTYKNETAGTCMENGKAMPLKPMRASTIWVRNGEKWQAVWHGENEIMTAPAAADDKKAEPKTDGKAEEPKKEDKPAANANANTAAPAQPAKLTPSANTDALVKAHAAGWEAFRNKDAKFFEANMASTFAFVDPAGNYVGSKADAIKNWTGSGTMKCEGITKTSFTDGFAQAISPTVEILFGKGSADGKCDGMANGDLWTAAVYVKEGDAWKLAYLFESFPNAGT